MLIHATRLPSTSNARYHARRLETLRVRIAGTNPPRCAECHALATPSRPAGFLQVNHVHGDGGVRRAAAKGQSGELTRLLGLSSEDLHAQVNLLCPTCHAQDVHTVLYRKASA